jgi:hypothetical protein
MGPHAENSNLPDFVSQLADEMNIHRAIDAIDGSKSNQDNETISEKEDAHIYYVSASSDAQREKAHIHKILQAKNRSYLKRFVPDKRRMTVICLWDDLYNDAPGCHAEFNDIVKKSKQHHIQLRIVIILLRPNIEISRQIPEGFICLPGFDRVSRELTIFKIVQEEPNQ